MRVNRVHHRASGQDFAIQCPDLAAWPVPVIRVALRAARIRLELASTPTIEHHHGGRRLVWLMEAATPTLVRPLRFLDDRFAVLDTDCGDHLVSVLSTRQVAACCRDVVSGPATHSEPDTDAARARPVHLAHQIRQPMLDLAHTALPAMSSADLADLLDQLTITAHLLPQVLAALLETIHRLDPDTMTTFECPDGDEPYGGSPGAHIAAAVTAIIGAVADTSYLTARISTACYHVDRLQPHCPLGAPQPSRPDGACGDVPG